MNDINSEENKGFNISFVEIVYKGGTRFRSRFSKGDSGIDKFKTALDEFISGQTNTVCKSNGGVKICEFFFTEKHRANLYTSSWHSFSDFDNLLYVEITHRDNKVNNTCKSDSEYYISLKQNDINRIYQNIRIHTSWVNRINNNNYGFSAFKAAWSDFRAGKPMKKKWEFKAECSKHETTLYLLEPSLIEHLHFSAKQSQP